MAPICSDEAGKLLVPSRPAANELPVKGDTRKQRGTWASAAKGAQIGQAKKRKNGTLIARALLHVFMPSSFLSM